jgi:hypothetical protein
METGFSQTLVPVYNTFITKKIMIVMLSRFRSFTVDGVWTGELIYWPLIHTTQNYKQLQSHCYSPESRKSPQHTLTVFQLAVPSPAVFWQRLLTVRLFSFTQWGPFFRAFLIITSQYGQSRNIRFHCFSTTVILLRIYCQATGKFLPSRCPETVAVHRVAA